MKSKLNGKSRELVVTLKKNVLFSPAIRTTYFIMQPPVSFIPVQKQHQRGAQWRHLGKKTYILEFIL